MKYISKADLFHISVCLLLLIATCLTATVARADIRTEAHSALLLMQNSIAPRSMPDEVRSAHATFEEAEHCHLANKLELSERYYLLAMQKIRVIMSTLDADRAASLATATPQDTGNSTTLPVTPSIDPEPPVAVQQEALPRMDAAETAPPHQAVDTPVPAELESPAEDILSEKLVGTAASTYTVVKGDTLRLVAAKLGVSRQHLLSANRLEAKSLLKAGQKLRFNNRKIIPLRMKNGIVVNIPDRTLYYFKQGRLAVSIPVALGVPVKNSKYDWKTPTGKFKITAKMKDPTWFVPPSIQSEMEDQGKETITSVPPGPTNPLGKYAIKTSIPGILIHSTTRPSSIYSFASHGCIRVYPAQMEEFFKEVKVDTPGEIIYQPVKLAVTETGRIFLEVHQDIYGKSNGLELEARHQIERQHLGTHVDWKKVESVVRLKSGIAEDISF